MWRNAIQMGDFQFYTIEETVYWMIGTLDDAEIPINRSLATELVQWLEFRPEDIAKPTFYLETCGIRYNARAQVYRLVGLKGPRAGMVGWFDREQALYLKDAFADELSRM